MRFGPSGNCITFYQSGCEKSVEAPKWLREHGLDAYEYSFGRGITLGDTTAEAIGAEAKKYDIQLSIHAPYYINFANPSDEMAEKSFMYVLNSLAKLRIMGGNRLVVHVASTAKQDRVEALELTKKRLTQLDQILKEQGYSDMLLCFENIGKPAQIGTYEEIFQLCTLSDQFIPTIDFGHVNALTGGSLKTEADYEVVIKRMFEVIGEEKAKKVHMHFSKIEYGAKGEIRHLTLEDEIYGPEFEPLAKVLKKYNINGTVICESKQQMAADAIILKQIYDNV